MERYKEDLLEQYRFISKQLNYLYNRLQLADTEQEEIDLLRDIQHLETQYSRVSYELDSLYV